MATQAVKKLALVAAAMGLAGAGFSASPASAEGYLQPLMAGRTNVHRNIDASDVDAMVTTLRESGRIVIDVEMDEICSRHVRNCLRFHMVSAPNTDGRSWDIVTGVQKTSYDNAWQRNVDRGYRPTDIEIDGIHQVNPNGAGGRTQFYFSGVWVENTERFRWASFSFIDNDTFDREFNERVKRGNMILVDHERDTWFGGRNAAIFIIPRREQNVTSRVSMSTSEYAALAPKAYGQQKRWPLYLGFGPGVRTSLMRDQRREARVFTALNDGQFRNRLTVARNDGFQLVDLEKNGNSWAVVFLRPRRQPVRTNPGS